MALTVFKRTEQKYLLDQEQYDYLMTRMENHIEKNKFFYSQIYNIYFDNDNYDLVRTSIEKPLYKEKIRLRSYGIPTLDDYVFLEIKKKYKGVVTKRRVELPLRKVYEYLKTGKLPIYTQIMKEIDYCFQKYQLHPVLFLAYDRFSYQDKENPDFRITFDFHLRSRKEDLKLELGDGGNLFFKEPKYIMEVKANHALPLWFVELLSDLKLYQTSFSKYGSIYQQKLERCDVKCSILS